MNSPDRFVVSSLGALCAAALLSGCATARKNMEPVSEKQKSEFLKGMEVVEQPALEPEWSDFVKDRYPNWRQHYWVDRGQWGNRGYLVRKPRAAGPGPGVVRLWKGRAPNWGPVFGGGPGRGGKPGFPRPKAAGRGRAGRG